MNDDLFKINERNRTRCGQLLGILILLCCFASICAQNSYQYEIEGESTNTEGRFNFIYNKKKVAPEDKHFLFVSIDNTKDALTTIYPPFDWVRQYDKSFDGKLVRFGSKDRIDVGDVKVQFWYGQADLSFSKTAANKIKWSQIYLKIRNKNGHMVYFSSLNQENIKRYIKNNGTEVAISLPEGRWKVEIIEFDTRRILAQSPYFRITRNSKPDIVMRNGS